MTEKPTRVPMVEPVSEPAELRPVFDQLRQTRGRVPGMYRTLAHQPAVLAAHRAYFHAALDAGVLPRPFKEMIAYKVAALRGSAYSMGSHRSYAMKHGVAPDVLNAVDRSDYSQLDERDRAAFDLAEAVVKNRGQVPDEIFVRLNRHYSPAEVVELTALIGIMELASTLSAVFELKPD
jgi:alkylhydroperoxidase family enzyme